MYESALKIHCDTEMPNSNGVGEAVNLRTESQQCNGGRG